MKFDWRGLIAAILAAGLSIALVMGVAGLIWRDRTLGEKGGEVMVAVCVAMVSAISAYFTARQNNNNKGDKGE